MEAGLASDEIAVVGQGHAPVGDDGVEVIERLEVAVDDGFVDMDPEGFGGLQLGGVGRQEDEPDALGHGERQGVVSGAVKDEDDDPVAAGAGLAGEEGEGALEELLADAGPEIPEALAGGGRYEGGDVEPFEAVVAAGDRTLALGAQTRRRIGFRPIRCSSVAKVSTVAPGWRAASSATTSASFLNAACSSGDAASAWRGRGRWIVQPIARSASQPRCSATWRPSSAAMNIATFFAVQTPPSSGGCRTRSRTAASSAGVSTVGAAPFPRRRSPRLPGPKAL